MAIYHLSAQFMSRSNGQSATAAAAYRAGEKVRSEDQIYTTKAKHQERLNEGVISERFKKQLAEKLTEHKIKEIEAKIEKEDDGGKKQVLEAERDSIKEQGVELTKNASVEKLENRWEITSGKTRYTIREEMVGRNKDKPELHIYSQSVHDYSRKGNVLWNGIDAPDGSPEWLKDRSELWTAHEAAAKRGDAQVAQEVRVALPRENNLEQNKEYLRGFVQENFVSRGMVADMSIHGDKDNNNPHAHILLTTREIEDNGFGKVNREWNDGRAGMRKQQLNTWRESWADHTNQAHENAESSERIDHRSHAERGIDREPTTHMGKEATAMEDKGEQTERGLKNRMIEHYNSVKTYIRERRESRMEDKTQERAALLARLKERGQAIAERAREMRTQMVERYRGRDYSPQVEQPPTQEMER